MVRIPFFIIIVFLIVTFESKAQNMVSVSNEVCVDVIEEYEKKYSPHRYKPKGNITMYSMYNSKEGTTHKVFLNVAGDIEKEEWYEGSKMYRVKTYSYNKDELQYSTNYYLSSPKDKDSTVYNKNGNVFKKFNSGELRGEYQYNVSGQLLLEKAYSSAGNLSQIIRYMYDGDLLINIEVDSKWEKEKLIKQGLPAEEINALKFTEKRTFNYDEAGNKIKAVIFLDENNKADQCVYEYDYKGNISSKRTGYDVKNEQGYVSTRKYYWEDTLLKRVEIYRNGCVEFKYEYQYDNNDWLVNKSYYTSYDETGTPCGEYQYEIVHHKTKVVYDDIGNLTQLTLYDGDNKIKNMFKWVIEYH